jgi:hypothetical protein
MQVILRISFLYYFQLSQVISDLFLRGFTFLFENKQHKHLKSSQKRFSIF